uniref:Uncharacterized protein n=1 Tax=Rhipicephalus zambeziensis TaxID=60191 RepID=A0A224YAU6_9ACAR
MDSAAYICSLQRRARTFHSTAAPDVTMLHRACALRKRKQIQPQALQTRVPCPALHCPMRTYASAITSTCRKAVFERNSVASGPYSRSYGVESVKRTML